MTIQDDSGLTIITVQVPRALNDKLDEDKKQFGISKSYIIRSILTQHYTSNNPLPLGLKVCS